MNEAGYARCCCASCGNPIEFPLEAAGSRVDCPHCSQPTELVPEFTEESAASETRGDAADFGGQGGNGPLTLDQVRLGFTGGVKPTATTLVYSVGMLLTAFIMVLLPVVYVGLIVLAGWGVYAFATHTWGMMTSRIGGLYFYFVRSMLYITPIFAGIVLVLFMIKPLFAKRAPGAQPLALNPDVEPLLFSFIREICLRVGAPMPTRIDLDCQLNAAASFRRGVLSLAGSDLVLTIGLPLVAGLSLRQLAGVLAHEFGHFTQGFGMRLSYLVRSINAWFARVVYGRDAWDVALEEWAADADNGWIVFMAGVAQLAVACSRLILTGFMFAGHGVSCFLLRQMEYDADNYEIRLAGSESFESTARRMGVLNEAMKVSYKQARASWNMNHRLPDNFPAFILQQEGALPDQIKQGILDSMGLSRTGFFDSHPSDGDRIRRARQAGEPGVFSLELPATMLFSDFPAAARLVTQVHYQDDLGLPLMMAKLVPTQRGSA